MSKKKKNDEKNLPAEVGGTDVAIPDQDLNNLLKMAEDHTIWVKVKEGGFKFPNSKIIPELVGQIRAITPHLILFENDKVKDKRSYVDGEEIPPGYEKRCDIKIRAQNQNIGMSLAPSTITNHLTPYVTYLLNEGLRPEQVITKLVTATARNEKGTWAIVVFEMVGMVDEVEIESVTSEAPPETPPTDDQIPSEWV